MTAINSNQIKVSQSMISGTGSDFEIMARKADASALIAHSDSSLRSARDLVFLPGFLAFGRAMVQAATTPQTRLIALIAASGNRSLGEVVRRVRSVVVVEAQKLLMG